MDNLINSKNIKCRINAINTKLSDNARFINNANNLIPITIFISNDKGKYYIQEHYADLSDKTLTIDDLDVYLDSIKTLQINTNASEPIIIRVLTEQEYGK